MLIFFLSLVTIGFTALLTNWYYRQNTPTLLVGGIILFCLAALRHDSVGIDVISYIDDFVSLKNYSYQEAAGWAEPGFTSLKLFIHFLTDNFSIYLAVLALIYVTSVFTFLSRYSKEAFMSIAMLISLGYFQFSLSGLRQSISIAIILFSYKYIKEKNPLYFLGIVLTAALFHNSALVFIIAYPIAHWKISLKHFIILISSIFTMLFFGEVLLGVVLSVLEFEFLSVRFNAYLGNQSALSLSGFVILFSIWLFCYLIYKRYDSHDQLAVLLNIVFVGLIFQSLTPIVGEFFRLAMYFSIFSIVLLPNSILLIKSVNFRAIVYMAILALLLLYYFLAGVYNYGLFKFYWE
jgi:hypothetical protein